MNKTVGLRRTDTIYFELNNPYLKGKKGERTTEGRNITGRSRNESQFFGAIHNSYLDGPHIYSWPNIENPDHTHVANVTFVNGDPEGDASLKSEWKIAGVTIVCHVKGRITASVLKNITIEISRESNETIPNKKRRTSTQRIGLIDQNVYEFKQNWNKLGFKIAKQSAAYHSPL